MKTLRVTICQPGLPRYRIPIFTELAGRPGIDLNVLYTTLKNLKNVEPESFKAKHFDQKVHLVGGRDVVWHGEHFAAATREQTDVLVLPWNIGHLSLIPTLAKARLNKVGTVLWGHGVSKSENLVRRSMRWRVGRMADAVMFYNHLAAGKFLEFERDRDRVFVAQNALDQTQIQAERRKWLKQPEQLVQFAAKVGLGEPMLLFVSRLFEDNRVDVLLRAVARLKAEYPDVTAVIVGDGPAEQSLRALTQELGITQNVRFAGSVYEESELAPYFLSADLFVYPTNLGLSILHAFGYGLPVLTGDLLHAHNPEIEALENGYNGILFRHLDDRDLAAKITELMKAPARLVSLSMVAHETATQKFTVKRMVDGIEAAVRFAAARAGNS